MAFAKRWAAIGFVSIALNASAQSPNRPVEGARAQLCQQIATAAFEANRGLQASAIQNDDVVPFVWSWLVPNAIVPDGDHGFTRTGKPRKCDGPVTERCYFRQVDDFESSELTVGLLPVGDELIAITADPEHGPFNYRYASGAFLKSANAKEGKICSFESRVHESYTPYNGETKDSCAALLSDGAEILDATQPVPDGIDQQMFRLDPRSTEFFLYDFQPLGTLKLDVDGDGAIEHLLKVRALPSNGRCWGRIYFDVLDARDPTKFSSAPVREAVLMAQSSKPGCGFETRIRKSGDRILFEQSGLDAVAKRGEPIIAKRAGLLERELREIAGREARPLCSTVFSVEPVVTFTR